MKIFGASRFLLLAGLVACTAVLIHCGDDDASPIPAPDGGVDGGGGGGTTDSSSSSNDADLASDTTGIPVNGNDGGGGGGGDGGDAAAIVIPDGGAPVDPGKVGCGTGPACASECCVQPDGGATCTVGGGACSALGGARQQCDEAADCPVIDGGQQVCCFEKDGDTGLLATSCHATCNGGGNGRVQACRNANECLSGACTLHACNPLTAGTASIESCNPFPTLCP